MRLLLQFRRYRLPFRTVVRTAHGPWSERKGLIVRLQDEAGAVAYGEAAVLPWFGTETADEAESACNELGGIVDHRRLAAVPAKLACLKNALTAAGSELAEGKAKPGAERRVKDNPPALGVAALLPAGRAALAEMAPKAEAGFRVFKWKVGVADVADELGLLDDVCAALPSGAKLRLDANGAWDRRKAERWLERCADRPVEFVEQPIAADARGARDALLGLAGDYPTPVALDESLVGESDVERWLGAGWPGVFVVKPALFADVKGVMARLAAARADVVFSSALETTVGARAALEVAFAWSKMRRGPEKKNHGSAQAATDAEPARINSDEPSPRALGFGVWPLFADARFDGPGLAPFIRWEDVTRMNAEAVWNALG